MLNLITRIHDSKVIGLFFHTLPYCLSNELSGCATVLDLGCGPNSPIRYSKNVKYSVGVEVFKPYIEISKKNKVHNDYINKKISDLDFKNKSFDAVILIEVLEHIKKEDAEIILKKIEKWAKKKIIITCPNGFVGQKAVDNNKYQKHLSGWTVEEMRLKGYSVLGLAGLKLLRKEVEDLTMGDNLMNSIKYKPKFFWFVIATLSQIVTYFFPKYAFELFCVKKLN